MRAFSEPDLCNRDVVAEIAQNDRMAFTEARDSGPADITDRDEAREICFQQVVATFDGAAPNPMELSRLRIQRVVEAVELPLEKSPPVGDP